MRNAIFSNYQPGGMFSVIDVNKHPGNVWFVDSGHTSASNSDGYGQNPDAPFATIDYAIGKCTANNGDVIYVMPGHAETLATATAMAIDVAGASVIGLGAGNDRPKITIGTLAAATIAASAASIAFKNIIVIGALDGLDSAITVTGDDCDIDIEYRDTSAAVESNIAILATSVDRGKFKVNYIGFIAGNAVTNAVVLDGCTSCDVDIAFYGIASTSIVEFLNNACHNINIKGYFYNSGTSDLSKNVVDTATGSTWHVTGFDGAAGCGFSGGSGAAIAGDDVSALIPAVDSYMLVQNTLDRSHMLVQAGLDRSYVLVQATADQSYMLVKANDQITANTSYMLVQTTLDRSHMLVQATADQSYMLVQSALDRSYMLVQADLIKSMILLLPST
jgi:hypothetical protein